MKEIIKTLDTRIIRFDNDDEVLAKLVDYCQTERITAGWISAIGACKALLLFFYNPETKKYEEHPVREDLEVVSMTGNIGVYKNAPLIHVHGVFSDNKLKTFGGHIDKLWVSATLEVRIDILKGQIDRDDDVKTCLKLMV